MAEHKQFPATEKKRREARRREGKVARSPFFTQSLQMLFFVLVLRYGGERWFHILLEQTAALANYALFPQQALVLFLEPVTYGCIGLFLYGIVGVGIEYRQTGLAWYPQGVNPGRLNPAQGLVNLSASISKVWRPLLRCTLLLMTVSWVIWWYINEFSSITTVGSITLFCDILVTILTALALAFLLIGSVDRLLEIHDYEIALSMNDDELRREQRENDGDPWVKAVRKGLHRGMALEELMRRVRHSKVVLTERAPSVIRQAR